ncbi:hypothetical protein E2320_020291, partial [Naja naja]
MEAATSPSRDECILYLISCFRARIKSSVQVNRVLDLMPSLSLDQKRQLRAVAGEKGDVEAAEKLLSVVEKEAPGTPGLCQEFSEALLKGGYAAADYLDPSLNDLPSPSSEATGDLGTALVNLFFDRLTDTLQATQVAFKCLGKGLLAVEDVERIVSLKNKQGNKSAVREMLCRIIQKKEWLSPFLEALGEAGHANMAAYISGHPNGVNGASDSTNEMYEAPDSEAVENLQPRTELQEALEDERNVAEKSFEDPPAISDHVESRDQRPSSEKELSLRDYQMEVAKPALEGKNIIICLPTGTGKTRVAVYIAKDHLDKKRKAKESGKVIVLVNKTSGLPQLKFSFPELIRDYDVIICTAKILENALEKVYEDDEERVQLSG